MASKTKSQRNFDVVIFGATGYTGALITQYFFKNYPLTKTRWALAGRSPCKLEQLRYSLMASENIPTLVADVSDQASLDKMCQQTKVLINCVGPFSLFGESVIRTCLAQGCDYLDITGEAEFMRQMAERYHSEAVKKGVLIVSACGFDSVPADFGVDFTRGIFAPGKPSSARGYLRLTSNDPRAMMVPGVSHGTWNTVIEMLSQQRVSRLVKNTLWDVAGFLTAEVPTPKRMLHGLKSIPRPHRLGGSRGLWAMPAPVADEFVVQATDTLVRNSGQSNFQYTHYVVVDSLVQLILLIIGVVFLFVMSRFKTPKKILKKFRDEGEGPNETEREAAHFSLVVRAEGSTAEGHKRRVTTRVAGPEPYNTTAIVSAEAALTVAFERDTLPSGGVLTPAFAFRSSSLPTRLEKGGISFAKLSDEIVM